MDVDAIIDDLNGLASDWHLQLIEAVKEKKQELTKSEAAMKKLNDSKITFDNLQLQLARMNSVIEQQKTELSEKNNLVGMLTSRIDQLTAELKQRPTEVNAGSESLKKEKQLKKNKETLDFHRHNVTKLRLSQIEIENDFLKKKVNELEETKNALEQIAKVTREDTSSFKIDQQQQQQQQYPTTNNLEFQKLKNENNELKEKLEKMKVELVEANRNFLCRMPIEEPDPLLELLNQRDEEQKKTKQYACKLEMENARLKSEQTKLNQEIFGLKQKLFCISPTHNNRSDSPSFAFATDVVDTPSKNKRSLEKKLADLTSRVEQLNVENQELRAQRDKSLQGCANYKERKATNKRLSNQVKALTQCVVLLKTAIFQQKQESFELRKDCQKLRNDIKYTMIPKLTSNDYWEIEKYFNGQLLNYSTDLPMSKKEFKEKLKKFEDTVERLTKENNRMMAEIRQLEEKNNFIEQEKIRTIDLLTDEVQKALANLPS